MGILTEEQKERLRNRGKKSFLSSALETSLLPGTDIDLSDAFRYIDRASKLAGLGVGTLAGATPLQFVPGVKDWIPDVSDENLVRGARSFWDQVQEGDWDAGIEAYQDELDAGKGFWLASEMLGGAALTGVPGAIGKGLVTAAPKIGARGFARFAPEGSRISAARAGEALTRRTGQVLKAPWEFEEAIGRVVAKPIIGAAKAGTRLLRGTREAAEDFFRPQDDIDAIIDGDTLPEASEDFFTPADTLPEDIPGVETVTPDLPTEVAPTPPRRPRGRPRKQPPQEQQVFDFIEADKVDAIDPTATFPKEQAASFTKAFDPQVDPPKRSRITSIGGQPVKQVPDVGETQQVTENIVEKVREELGGKLDQSVQENPLNPKQTIFSTDEGVSIKATLTPSSISGNLRINDIESLEPGRGNINRWLKALAEIADENNITIELTATPFGTVKPLSTTQLKNLYKKFGFQFERGSADGIRIPELISPLDDPIARTDIYAGAKDALFVPRMSTRLDETKEQVEDFITDAMTEDEMAIPGTAQYTRKGETTAVPLNRAVTLFRLHEGAVNQMNSNLNILIRNGEKIFNPLGMSVSRKGREILRKSAVGTKEEPGPVMTLFRALHGSKEAIANLDPRLRSAYDELRNLTDWEESLRIDFEPELNLVGRWQHDEAAYFYRGWRMGDDLKKAVKARGKGLGWPPEFAKPRRNATFDEMLNAGYEPLSWNPYEQFRIGTLQSMRYRQQIILVNRLKKLGLAQSYGAADMTPIDGWRVPRVGPAFEGKARVRQNEAGETLGYSINRWVVPNEVATRLENLYGRVPDPGEIMGVNVMKVIDAITFLPKRAKLFLSFFQQTDFLTRSFAGTWTKMVDDLQYGVKAGDPKAALASVKHLATWPKSAKDILKANFNPDYRDQLKLQLQSTDELIPGRPGIHMKGIMDGGLAIRDVTMFPREMDEYAKAIADEDGLSGLGKIKTLISEIDSASRRGLFDGVYPAAQMTDIKNNVAQMMFRKFPNASDEQINGQIARFINMKYSTIPASQSVFQNQVLRATLQRIFFSIGESEGLLRQAFETIPGTGAAARGIEGVAAKFGKELTVPIGGRKYKSLWIKHYIGAYLALIATANLIHITTTGKPLPVDRYVPLSRDNWGFMPISYNTTFAAPNVPIPGRGGTQNTLDLVGQMDTAFRVLDPKTFLQSRESVPVRAIQNQLIGENFFGEPIDDVGPGGIVSRTASAILDTFAPIGIGQTASGLARQNIGPLEEILPFGEERIGTGGQLAQGFGINIRGEQTRDLRNRMTRESGLINRSTGEPLQKWDDASPGQKDEIRRKFPQELREEEMERTRISAARGQEYAITEMDRRAYQDSLQSKLEATTSKFLAHPFESRNFNPRIARSDINEARTIYYNEIYGTVWDEQKRRFTKGLYDEDQTFPEPELGTPEHNVWRYYQLFTEARDEQGKISFDGEAGETFNERESKFWSSLTPQETGWVLDDIRLIEGNFPEEVKVVLNAGRYAAIFKQQIEGQNLSYYDLEGHPAVLNEMVKNSGASVAQVQEYLDTPYKQRNALQKESQVWRDIDKAMNKSKAENGALYKLKDAFINQAPEEWMMAMIQAGYTYQGSQRDSELFSDQLRKGLTYRMPTSSDYEGMFRRTLTQSVR